MFTGIIEEIGTIENIKINGTSGIIKINAQKVLENTKIGDSIAVNGVCLTVIDIRKTGFSADVMAETVRKTGLGDLKSGSKVNLERAMQMNGRFGGHIVSGHVDTVGQIFKKQKEENGTWFYIKIQKANAKYIVDEGSITIDGISLTVAKTGDDWFAVSIIPHTGVATTLIEKSIGDKVNLETDIIGKYVEKLLGLKKDKEEKKDISFDFLKENGFM